MNAESEQLGRLAVWFALLRALAVPIALAYVSAADFPSLYGPWPWIACGVLVAGAAVFLVLSRNDFGLHARRRLAELSLLFDTGIVFAFVFLSAYMDGQPLWALFYLPVLEAAIRWGTIGGLVAPLATGPGLLVAEVWRAQRFAPEVVRFEAVATRVAIGVVVGLLVGRLVSALLQQTREAELRAGESEQLRDELGRRVDVLEAANRCARALGSSLELEQAIGSFIRELRGLVPFDRMAIVLAEEGSARVLATAGAGADTVLPPGSVRPVEESVLEQVLRGQIVYRSDLADGRHPEEQVLLDLGLRSRICAPLLLGARAIGMLAVVRAQPGAFTPEEIELLSLLGRLVATAVQNIRAYEAERATVEELRRLSALRADFVSLVSHELRSPMAAVIGSARTLQQRWRELAPEQRESFLDLIAEETTRLATLIGDVLDTSRIEAGTFSYSFSDVDLGALVRDAVAAAGAGQDEVRLRPSVREPLPAVRGDRERLRQVLMNLIDNAVKYSPAGEDVVVAAYRQGTSVCVDVVDRGPGIAPEHQRLIFEKFGRAQGNGGGKPGTGLGLFIARSIAEAHGGTLDVRSAPKRGTTFTLVLPAT